ncbi:MAG TPA: hypothetical protein VF335_05070, partial [Chitinivibrionales bacterium]
TCNLPSQTVTITTTAVPAETYTEQGTSTEEYRQQSVQPLYLGLISTAKGFFFHCPSITGTLKIFDMRGKTLWSKQVEKDAFQKVGRKGFGAGMLYAEWNDGNRHIVKQLPNTY